MATMGVATGMAAHATGDTLQSARVHSCHYRCRGASSSSFSPSSALVSSSIAKAGGSRQAVPSCLWADAKEKERRAMNAVSSPPYPSSSSSSSAPLSLSSTEGTSPRRRTTAMVQECKPWQKRQERCTACHVSGVPYFSSTGLRSTRKGDDDVAGLFRRRRHASSSVAFFSAVHEAISNCGVIDTDARRGGGRRGEVTMMPIGTPKVPYRTPGEGGWQWVDIWNVLYRERIIFVGQYIDEEFGNQVIATMLYLDSLDSTKPMYLYINSPGGEITPSMAIFDTMQSIASPVGTLCFGYAYNMACFLLAAGEKGKRAAMPMTRVALQPPAGSARGQADDIQNEANELLRVRKYMYNVLSEKTGRPVEEITKDLSRIKRFDAKQALEYGIIDRVVRPIRIKKSAAPKEVSAGFT